MYKRMFFLVVPLAFMITVSCAMAQKVELDRVDIEFSNISSVKVDGAFCDVTIQAQPGDKTELKALLEGASSLKGSKIKYNVDNATLHISVEVPNSIWNNIEGKIQLKVPTNTNIEVDNSSGSVTIDGIGNANVSVETSSGSIIATNIDSNLSGSSSSGSQNISGIKGMVKTSSSSGSLIISDVGNGVSAEASSGGIGISKVNGPVSAETSSGSININNVKGRVEAEATSGSIGINQINGDVEAETSSGSIQLHDVIGALELNSTSGSQSGNNITLTGNSSFESSSGSIDMGLTNKAEELSFNLNASSGGLNGKGIKASGELIIDKGSIKITGESSSGSQSYY